MRAGAALFLTTCALERSSVVRRDDDAVAHREIEPAHASSLDALTRCRSSDDDVRDAEYSVRLDRDAPPVPTAEGRFEVRVEQHGRALPIAHHVVELHRTAFDVVVTLPLYRGVYVSTSVRSELFEAARDRLPLLRHVRDTAVVAEELRDADADLWLDDEPYVFSKLDAQGVRTWECESASASIQYLYYDGPEENRFSDVRFEHGTLVGRRRVEAVKRPLETLGIGRRDSEEAEYVDERIEDLVEDSLYLVLVEDQPGSHEWMPAQREAFERSHPLQRRFFRLHFIEPGPAPR